MRSLWLVIVGTLLFTGAGLVCGSSISDLELRDHWMGDAIDGEYLKDRTVLIEFWGFNCPPCRASLPRLVKLQEEGRKKGLVVIGIHSQNVPKDQVLGFCREHNVNFSVYGTGRIKGVDFEGIPKVFIFDASGELAFDGRTDGMESMVEALLKRAPDWLTGPRKYVKVKTEADKIRKRKGMGQAVAILREKAQGSDPQEKEEAEELLKRIDKHAKREINRAKSFLSSGDPLKAKEIWKTLAKDFKGDEIGNSAASIEKEKTKDEAFKREIAAAKLFTKIQKAASKLKPQRRDQSLDKWRKKNARFLSQIKNGFKALEKKYDDTKVCERARKFVKSWIQ